MRGESGGLSSIDHALAAALLTADVALRGGDRAGLPHVRRPAPELPPSDRRQERRAQADPRRLRARCRPCRDRLPRRDGVPEGQVKARSLLVIFTNVLDERAAKDLSQAVRALLPRHLPLCVLMRDTAVEALAVAPVAEDSDLFVGAAAGEILAREALLGELRDAGAFVLDARPEDVTPALVNRYLEIEGTPAPLTFASRALARAGINRT